MTRVNQLHKIYNNPQDPGSFGGVKRLLQSAKDKGFKFKRKHVEKYLLSNDTYTLHKPIRKHFKRNMIIVSDIDKQWQADLADMHDIATSNDVFKYLLNVIDCFSKFAWSIPLKKKDSKSLLDAFKLLLQQSYPRKPIRLQTDKGLEFMNKDVQAFLKTNNIIHFTSQSDMKAAMVERFNRTIKTRIFAYLTSINSKRYIDKLQDFMDSYNNSYHRTIGMKPIDVKPIHVNTIFTKVYGKFLASRQPTKPKPNKVRIGKQKSTFDKGYLPNWTSEIFQVHKSLAEPGKTVYKLKDLQGEEILGKFYDDEIQSVKLKNLYKVEKVLKTRKAKQGKEFFVKWQGYPEKFNSWIPEKYV